MEKQSSLLSKLTKYISDFIGSFACLKSYWMQHEDHLVNCGQY